MLWLILGILLVAAAFGVLAFVVKLTLAIVLSVMLLIALTIGVAVWTFRWRMYRYRKNVEEWRRRTGRTDLNSR
jgi:membrane protein YdbS with pleckstrin-like domain